MFSLKIGGEMKLLLGVTLLFLMGCSDNSTHGQSLGFRFTTDAVKEVSLSDGTKCAVYQGIHGGGITCDWKN